MSFLGADDFVFNKQWDQLAELISDHKQCAHSTNLIQNGIRSAMDVLLKLGKIQEFFQAIDRVGARRGVRAFIPTIVADYIKLQLEELKKGSTADKDEHNHLLYTTLVELQKREDVQAMVRAHLKPKILFAVAAHTTTQKDRRKIKTPQPHGVPVVVLRETQKQGQSSGFSYHIIAEYHHEKSRTTVYGRARPLILDALKRHDGTPSHTLNDAAATIVHMRQCFWDLAKQVKTSPHEKDSVWHQFDLTHTLIQNKSILFKCFPKLDVLKLDRVVFCSAETQFRKCKSALQQSPDDKILEKKVVQAQKRLDAMRQALMLVQRLKKIRNLLHHDRRAQSMDSYRHQAKHGSPKRRTKLVATEQATPA